LSKNENNPEEAKIQATLLGSIPNRPGMPVSPYPPIPGTPGCPPSLPNSGIQLARAYIPIQSFGQIYDFSTALKTGTLFVDLYRPYSC